MAIFDLISFGETLRVQVTARSVRADRQRRTRISSALLQVYDAVRSWERRFSVEVKGPTFHDTGLPPFRWQLIPGDVQNRISPVLRILLARGAYIEDLETV